MKAQLRPVPSYFWWLREAQVRAGVSTIRQIKDTTNNSEAASARRSSAA